MYSQKPISNSFRKPQEKDTSAPTPTSVPIEAAEKTKETSGQTFLSPLAALLFLKLFSPQKKKG